MQKICFVVPCYNEALRLPTNDFFDFSIQNDGVDFCFVNDGSTDNTLSVLEELKYRNSKQIFILDLKENGGKAEAVRQGVLFTCGSDQYSHIGFLDADLATPLSQIPLFINIKEKSFVLGSRIRRLGSKIERTPTRHYLGRIFSTCASVILKLPVYDTQCGAKLLKKDLAVQIFEDKFITKWLFDIELLARTIGVFGRGEAMERIYEVPLTAWEEKAGSKLKLKHLLKVPMELFKISRRYIDLLSKK